MAKCIICGGALWHTPECPMRDHGFTRWSDLLEAASQSGYDALEKHVQEHAIENSPTLRKILGMDVVVDPSIPPGTVIISDLNEMEESEFHHCVIRSGRRFGMTVTQPIYNTEKIKDKMRRGILWEGWLAAARRNARNG